MKLKRSLLIIIILFMFSSAAYAFTANYLAKYDFDGVKLVPKAAGAKPEDPGDASSITMEPVNVSDGVWLRELSEGNLMITLGSLELTKDQSTGLTESYIEISGEKGSKMLLSNSFSNNGSYTMTQYWDFKRLEQTSIVKGSNQGDIRSALLFTRENQGYTEYFLVGYLNSDVDYWSAGIPVENYYYARVPN